MKTSIAQQLDAVQRKSVDMRLRSNGEPSHKRLVDPNAGRAFGQIIERAIELGGLTKQGVAIELGYSDQSPVSRWIAGIENAPLARLLAVPGFDKGFLLALVEKVKGASVRTVVEIAS